MKKKKHKLSKKQMLALDSLNVRQKLKVTEIEFHPILIDCGEYGMQPGIRFGPKKSLRIVHKK